MTSLGNTPITIPSETQPWSLCSVAVLTTILCSLWILFIVQRSHIPPRSALGPWPCPLPLVTCRNNFSFSTELITFFYRCYCVSGEWLSFVVEINPWLRLCVTWVHIKERPYDVSVLSRCCFFLREDSRPRQLWQKLAKALDFAVSLNIVLIACWIINECRILVTAREAWSFRDTWGPRDPDRDRTFAIQPKKPSLGRCGSSAFRFFYFWFLFYFVFLLCF